MDIGSGLVALTAIGCGTAIVLTFIDKVFGGRQKQHQQQLRAAEERARQLELQLAVERQHNDQLQRQVEWHGKLLETQDRMLDKLSGPSSDGERALPEQTAAR
jgi:hypothetical protein